MLVTKFSHGAYLVVIAIPVLYAVMRGIRGHYDKTARELTPEPGGGMMLAYIAQLRQAGPQDVIVAYIPEYVVGHWWEHLLHNQSALRLKARLLFQHGVMVTSVPWQLESSRSHDKQTAPPEHAAPVAADRPTAAV